MHVSHHSLLSAHLSSLHHSTHCHSPLSPSLTMTTAWDAWPSTPPSMSPLSRSPRSPAVVAFTPGGMMSFSPRASFDRSWALTARLSPPSVNVPTLPPEIIRRIIRHALALPPTAPPRIRRDAKTGAPVNAPTPDWDMYAGKARARARHGEAAARESVMRTARTLLHVCRAWKVSVRTWVWSARGPRSERLPLDVTTLASCTR